jgi:hypothetical protein
MAWALTGVIVVTVLSGGVAYLTFGILDSSAEGAMREWRLGGAIAGFAFTALLLTSVIFQFYKEISRDKAEAYLKQIQELQTKLIRGAPQPPGFTIDIDERHKVVFARPVAWIPLGGVRYQYMAPSPPGGSDGLQANFNVVIETPYELASYGISPDRLLNQGDLSAEELDGLYESAIERLLVALPHMFPGYAKEGFGTEVVFVDGLKSVRYTHTYSRQSSGAQGTDPKDGPRVRVTQVGICIYHPRLPAMFTFTFSDEADDFLASSEDFTHIVSSIRFL